MEKVKQLKLVLTRGGLRNIWEYEDEETSVIIAAIAREGFFASVSARYSVQVENKVVSGTVDVDNFCVCPDEVDILKAQIAAYVQTQRKHNISAQDVVLTQILPSKAQDADIRIWDLLH